MSASNLLSRLVGNRHKAKEFLPTGGQHSSRREQGIVFGDVSFSRGSRPVFHGFSIEMREHRIGLIGDNGSGKSTLLRLVNGLLLPDQGRITVNAFDTKRDRRDLPGEVGFLFQNPDHQIIFPTIGEELSFGLLEQGIDAETARECALKILARNGWGGWERRAVHELSDGQKQLLCILAVIAAEPSIVLLDEPFASLDLPSRLALAARIAELPQQIVMASHDHHLLADFDRVIWLRNGCVHADGPPQTVLAAYQAHAWAAVA